MNYINSLMKTGLGVALIFAIICLSISSAFGHAGVSVTSEVTATSPIIDGILSPYEWSSAGTLPFTIQNVSGILYVMHDSTFLYVAAVISDATSGLNSFQLIFDNNNDGVAELGDDALVVNLGTNSGGDDYFNGTCCYLFDYTDGGFSDITSFGRHANNQATFELKHPLCSSDTAHDFCLAPRSIVGFNIVYQPGNGAFYSGFPSSSPFDTALFGDLLIPSEIGPIKIDIKPGSDPNSINPRSRGVIPVAILTTEDFDATAVDLSTVLFGKTGTEASPFHYAFEDVDGDGYIDMILHFKTQETGLVCGNTEAILTGETLNGQAIEGSDSIKTVGCENKTLNRRHRSWKGLIGP